MNEKALLKKRWWWRDKKQRAIFGPTEGSAGSLSPAKTEEWKINEELIAWQYELVRRHPGNDTLLAPYPEAKKADHLVLALLDDFSPIKPRREVLRINQLPVADDHLIPRKRNWSDCFALQCDLSATDNQLSAQFLNLVRAERKK